MESVSCLDCFEQIRPVAVRGALERRLHVWLIASHRRRQPPPCCHLYTTNGQPRVGCAQTKAHTTYADNALFHFLNTHTRSTWLINDLPSSTSVHILSRADNALWHCQTSVCVSQYSSKSTKKTKQHLLLNPFNSLAPVINFPPRLMRAFFCLSEETTEIERNRIKFTMSPQPPCEVWAAAALFFISHRHPFGFHVLRRRP